MAATTQADPDRLDFFPGGIGYGDDVDAVVRAAMDCPGDPWADRAFLARVVAALADQSNVPSEIVDAVSMLISEPNRPKAVRVAKAVRSVLR